MSWKPLWPTLDLYIGAGKHAVADGTWLCQESQETTEEEEPVETALFVNAPMLVGSLQVSQPGRMPLGWIFARLRGTRFARLDAKPPTEPDHRKVCSRGCQASAANSVYGCSETSL